MGDRALVAGLWKQDLFGPPALILGEEPAAYEALRAAIWAALQPKDVLEEISVRDIGDCIWEALRLHRLKANFLHVAAHEGVEKILISLTSSFRSSKDLAARWARHEPSAAKEVAAIFASADLTIDAAMGQAFVAKLDPIERLNRMAVGAEARRHLSLREFDRRRAAVATASKEKKNQGAYASFFKK
jgi:hypothetical protein